MRAFLNGRWLVWQNFMVDVFEFEPDVAATNCNEGFAPILLFVSVRFKAVAMLGSV